MKTYTTQAQVRAAFWRELELVWCKKIRDYDDTRHMHTTDTRCAFVDYVDMLARDSLISSRLADRVTL